MPAASWEGMLRLRVPPREAARESIRDVAVAIPSRSKPQRLPMTCVKRAAAARSKPRPSRRPAIEKPPGPCSASIQSPRPRRRSHLAFPPGFPGSCLAGLMGCPEARIVLPLNPERLLPASEGLPGIGERPIRHFPATLAVDRGRDQSSVCVTGSSPGILNPSGATGPLPFRSPFLR